MEKDLISIIIPLYNAEKYIKKNIDELLLPTYQNFEIIIVDDGSTDNSYKVVNDNYKTQINSGKIKIIKQDNFGAPAARNKGMEIAKGEYYIFLDADDYYSKEAIEKLHNAIVEGKKDLVVSNISMVDKNGKLIEKNAYSNKKDNYNLERVEFYLYSEIPLGKIYRASIIKEYNIKWENLRARQDTNFYYKFICCTDKILFIDDNTGYYRILENSIAHSKNLNLLDLEKSLSGIEKFCKIHNLYEQYKDYLVISKIQKYSANLTNCINDYNNKHYRQFIIYFFKQRLKKINLDETNLNSSQKKELKKIMSKAIIKASFPRLFRAYSKIKRRIFK